MAFMSYWLRLHEKINSLSSRCLGGVVFLLFCGNTWDPCVIIISWKSNRWLMSSHSCSGTNTNDLVVKSKSQAQLLVSFKSLNYTSFPNNFWTDLVSLKRWACLYPVTRYMVDHTSRRRSQIWRFDTFPLYWIYLENGHLQMHGYGTSEQAHILLQPIIASLGHIKKKHDSLWIRDLDFQHWLSPALTTNSSSLINTT